MITAALAVMMALTGIAAADEPTDEHISISPLGTLPIAFSPSYTTTTVTIANIFDLASTHTIVATTLGAAAPGTVADLEYSWDGGSTWIGSGTGFGWGPAGTSPQSLTLLIRAKPGSPTNNYYDIKIDDIGGSLPAGSAETDALTTAGQTIPEFATVAIPIAAVLGLVFFFQQRKNKKE